MTSIPAPSPTAAPAAASSLAPAAAIATARMPSKAASIAASIRSASSLLGNLAQGTSSTTASPVTTATPVLPFSPAICGQGYRGSGSNLLPWTWMRLSPPIPRNGTGSTGLVPAPWRQLAAAGAGRTAGESSIPRLLLAVRRHLVCRQGVDKQRLGGGRVADLRDPARRAHRARPAGERGQYRS